MNNNKGQMNSKEIQIQGLVDLFLRANTNNGFEVNSDHLDEDMLTAFVEGNLTEREAMPVTTHLVGCSFCRHITAELIKLDYAFAGDNRTVSVASAEPTKVADVLSGILSRIFGNSDSAVFAHQETEKDPDSDEEE
jgi:hypothetical protein